MIKHGSFKKIGRRHAQATGQRYSEALTDLAGLDARLFHEPNGEHARPQRRRDRTDGCRR
jgi:hypothetical protein